jgi:alpha-L-arabinofuranosidase
MTRRAFMGSAGGAIAVLLPSIPAVAVDSSIDIRLDETLGTINPNLYGHFTENLGGVIYDGVWVGEDSPIPNVGGIRKDLIDALQQIKSPVIRFPGGCYADSYDWRDGIGPRTNRPRRTNFWASQIPTSAPLDQKYDTNAFGTNEFIRLCRLSGAQPYLVGNLRSLPAEEFGRWVEYCNAPVGATTLADARAAGGEAKPFSVRFWGVGNEAWGCGGEFSPEEYAGEFCRYVSAVPDFGMPLSFIAAGPDKDDWGWTHGFFEAIARRGAGAFENVYGFSLHYYTWNLSRGRTSDFEKGKGDALRFDEVDWYELLLQGDRMESLIDRHWKIMGETDSQHAVSLIVDEWGSWYRPGSAQTPEHLFEQTPTLRDALFSAITLDTFNRNAHKVAMANCAQLINCLNSLFLAHENMFCVTPVGYVFAMYAAHQNGQSVQVDFSAPEIRYERDGKQAAFWGLKGSASLHDKKLVVTVVNPHVRQERESLIHVRGATVNGGTATVLSSSDIHALNTFRDPQLVNPKTASFGGNGRVVFTTFPPASVTKLTLTLE